MADRLVREVEEGKRPRSVLDGWQVGDGTRAMLERIGRLATQEEFDAEEAEADAWRRNEATTEPMILVVKFDEPDAEP